MPKTPAYQRIKSAILENIHNGSWQVGLAIPTEMALAEQFNVSRMTVNRALKELTDEQILVRVQGSGTFVAQQKFNQTFITIGNIAHDIKNQGKPYHAQVVRQAHQDHDELPVFARTIFGQTQRLFLVEIVHFGDALPLQVEQRWVDLNLVADFAHQDFSTTNTSDYLIGQVPLVRGHYFIEAKPCPFDIAKWLDCPAHSPALCLSRYTYSGNQVVTFVQMWHDGASFRFDGSI